MVHLFLPFLWGVFFLIYRFKNWGGGGLDWRKVAEDWNQDLAVTCHVCYAIDAVSRGLVYQSLLVGGEGKNTMMFCPIKRTCHLFFYFLYARSTSIIWMSIACCAFMRSFWPPLDVTLIVHVLFWTDTDTGCSAPCNNQPPVSLGKDYFVD